MTKLDNVKKAYFLNNFNPEHLQFLADCSRFKKFGKGEDIIKEFDAADSCYILVEGKIQTSFHRSQETERKDKTQQHLSKHLSQRTINEAGSPIGWVGMIEPYHHRAKVTAIEGTEVLVFKRNDLESYAREKPEFGLALMQGIILILGRLLRELRARLVVRHYDREALAIRALLEQNAELLSVSSPLHKIPLYLENQLTYSDALETLESLKVQGTEIERNISDLCLELLDKVHRELQLILKLQYCYDIIANAPQNMSSEQINTRCCQEFIKLFENTEHIIKGQENLPDKTGNIFIMNHLKPHTDYLLPNGFYITSDTHFVSSMIIYRKYKEAPIRVVRRSHSSEYGHKKYFDRLGYIYVPSMDAAKEERTLQREQFLKISAEYLKKGKNMVICPEGNSTQTENSPLPFKAGVFTLAEYADPEPLIVPIAIANFDKKMSNTTLVAIIHEPFYLSKYVPKPYETNRLFDFINNYRNKYRKYVQEAIRLINSLEKI